MRKLASAILVISLSISTLLFGCQGDQPAPVPSESLPSPTNVEAPDDIVITPGGYMYKANIFQQGVTNPWPPVHFDNVNLDDLDISYRAIIETKAGETRNNLIEIYRDIGIYDTELTLYSLDVPDGITVTKAGGGGRPGMLEDVLTIVISSGVSSGQYSFKIGIKLNDKDYGTVPCTINVIE